MPSTIEGCTNVLQVAARIIRVVRGDDPWTDADERRER